MTVSVLEILDHTRNEVLRDVVGPFLFSDESLLRFLNEGYKLFARHTHCFIDELETLTTVAGTARYDLPVDTIFLRQAFIENRPLTGYTRRAKPNMGLTGKPRAYTTDARHKVVKLYPTPDDVFEVELHRAVSPALVDQSSDIELDYEWALLLPHWVAYRALSNNDPDGSNTVAAQGFYQSWGVGLREAKMDFTRQAMGDNPSAQPRSWT